MRLDLNSGKGFPVFFKALAEVGTQVHELVRDGYLDWGPRNFYLRQLWPTQAQIHRKRFSIDVNAPQAGSALKDARIRVR